MGKKFCPKCGEETEKFFENLCEKCFTKKVSFSGELPDKMTVRTCKSCGKIFVGKKAVGTATQAVDVMLSKILEKPEVESASYRISDGVIYVTLNMKVSGAVKTEERQIKLQEKSILCEYCGMKASKYYQSTLQIRAPENVLGKVVEDVEKHAEVMNKYDDFAFISSVEKVRGGFDILFGSKQAAKQIANNLKKKYHAEIKTSSKLSGAIRGKKAYKDTILVSIK